MKYAVIKTGGKQYEVTEGSVIEIERLTAEAGTAYSFSEILLYVNEDARFIGTPKLSDVVVAGKVIAHTKGDKIRVSKFKSKVRYRRTMGHRQTLSKVIIEQIGRDGEKRAEAPKKEEKVAKEKPVKKSAAKKK